MHAHLAEPAARALSSASGAASSLCRGDLSGACAAAVGCTNQIRVVHTFWPLVDRHGDHSEWRGRAKGKRTADCTHYMPCSGSMMLLNQLVVNAIAALPVHSKQQH